jgi:hypothetical protein
MRTELLLQCCLATTVVLATLLLGMGQQNLVLPAMAIFSAGTSVYFTDYRGWFRLNRHVANLAALGAVGFATFDFIETDPNTRLLAIANLLVYLQMVLFYQQKNERLYWQLLVLSLLQVVVAAALNLGVEFGFLLALYLLLALTSLSLVFTHCESAPFQRESMPAGDTDSGQPTDMHGEVALQHARVRSTPMFVEVRDTARANQLMFDLGMWWHVLRLSVVSAALTFLVFFLTPRFGKSAWQGAVSATDNMIGFSDEVSLNQVGTMQEDDTVVMRVHFETMTSRAPYTVQGDMYMRGAVLSDYTPYDGTWRPAPVNQRSADYVIPELPTHRDMVRQVIQTEPSRNLFTVTPAYALPQETPKDLRIHSDTFQLFQAPISEASGKVTAMRYALATNAFHGGRQRRVIPCRPRGQGGRSAAGLRAENLRRDEEALGQLMALADQIVEESGVDRDHPFLVADAIERHFTTPDNYRYSLTIGEPAPRDQDPTEFFATRYKVGHCEYFASAMTLMLRHFGIPARMVVGYHGADYNELGKFYQVKNLHAHAWVEAYMDAGFAPAAELPASIPVDDGVWVRFDPTPMSDAEQEEEDAEGFVAQFKKFRDYFELLWTDYILGLDYERQRETIYRPIWNETISLFRDVLFSGKWWRTFGGELIDKMGMNSWQSFRARWFNWRAAPILVGTFLLLFALCHFNRDRLQQGARWLASRPAALAAWSRTARLRHRAPYRRLERVLGKHGIKRRSVDTPLEFARHAAATLGARNYPSAIVAIPELITLAFYRERFGQHPLDASESQAVEHSLSKLESALAAS